MEKFYLVTDESSLKEKYLNYRKNRGIVRDFTIRFLEKHGIKTESYYPTELYLYIVPTKEDNEKFEKQLCRNSHNGLRQFKKNSKINKDWIACSRQENIKVLENPHVGSYFNNIFMAYRSRLFEYKDNVYCSYSTEGGFKTPKGFEEMKASEFFKIIEEIQEE